METCQIQNSDLLRGFQKGLQAKIIEFAVKRENQGYKGVKHVIYTLRKLVSSGANLFDPESVKATIRKLDLKESTKDTYCIEYESFLKFLGGTWERPRYDRQRGIPFIPLEEELDQLIAALSPMVSTACQILKETGARAGEVARLKWTDVDFERSIINIDQPEKGSLPRLVKVSDKCIAMIKRRPKDKPTIFWNLRSVKSGYYTQRRRIAYKLNNPRLLKVGLKTFRQWHATMEYHKTKDIIHVQQRLGHKSIQNTLVYITIEETLFQGDPEEFVSRVAHNIEEACELIEAGFEYVGNIHSAEIFRRRK